MSSQYLYSPGSRQANDAIRRINEKTQETATRLRDRKAGEDDITQEDLETKATAAEANAAAQIAEITTNGISVDAYKAIVGLQ